MIESLNTIRTLGLAPVFESLYFGREVPANVAVYMRYPNMFRNATLAQCEPLTEGGLVPIVDDGNGYNICLFDPRRGAFVVKFIEEPHRVVREFASWQQYLAYALLEIADSGLSEEELVEVAQATGFKRTGELIALLREMESLPDREIDQRCERFIEECAA
jgi:hypothetical protein